MPKCPKCGSEMMGGAPHGPWPIQYECHRCGKIVVPTQSGGSVYARPDPSDAEIVEALNFGRYFGGRE